MTTDESLKKPCLRCKEHFLPRREWQKWCSAECRVAWYRETIQEALQRGAALNEKAKE